MILCVTLNPCLDKTLTVPTWRPGDLVRGIAAREVVGGKGNNVARALKRMGRSPRPVMFLGGTVGDHCAELLRREDGLDPILVMTQAPTRVILTVNTRGTTDQTAFFDPDPTITTTEAETLVGQIEHALSSGGVSALTLSGSSPSTATHGIYSDLISLARARKIPVFLDTYGPALQGIWGFWPSAIQLNRKEAAGQLHKPSATDKDVLGLLDDWHRHGVTCGIVTDGPNPVLIRCRDKHYRAFPPAIKPVNPIGSGDSLLAGLVDSWLAGSDTEPMIRHAIGCAVANATVWDAGAVDPEAAKRFADEVVLEPVGRGA
jgi:1-phosphofructokinase family hexose kinase